ncbi:MAG TPA: hypothetical protein VKA10_03315 [Prolixibacteraceae bacterium]|nr:hypothetical protein [Prolixibacteraceae bacterium]
MNLTNDQLKLFGLCFGCPEITPLSGCPVEIHRNKTAAEKMMFVKSLSLDEASRQIEAHEKCLRNRVRQRLLFNAV